jgi:hypothetical protein
MAGRKATRNVISRLAMLAFHLLRASGRRRGEDSADDEMMEQMQAEMKQAHEQMQGHMKQMREHMVGMSGMMQPHRGEMQKACHGAGAAAAPK